VKISFIIPVYNAELTLQKCVESIFGSQLADEEIEIVMVDDGSRDNSVAVAQQICLQHKNAVLIRQENHGSSVARNAGIARATGDYLWFVDSDDYLDKTVLHEILGEITRNGCPDIHVILMTCLVNGVKKQASEVGVLPHNVVITGKQAVLNGYMPGSVCGMLCKKAFVDAHNLKFYVGISHQDVEFSMWAMALASSVFFSDYNAYVYVKHEWSVSQAQTAEKLYFYIIGDLYVGTSFRQFSTTLSDAELSNHILRMGNNILAGMIMSLRRHKSSLVTRDFVDKVIDEMESKGAYPLHGPFLSWKIWLMSRLLNCKWYVRNGRR